MLHTPKRTSPPTSLLAREIDQLVEYRPRQPRLDPAAHEYIGTRLAARRGLDPQRVIGPGRHNIVQIGPEDQLLAAAVAGGGQLHGEKGNVLDLDAAALGRGDEPIGPVGVAAQDRGEQLDQRQPADRRPVMMPGAVAGDADAEIAAIAHEPPGRGTGPFVGGIAGAAIFHQARTRQRV